MDVKRIKKAALPHFTTHFKDITLDHPQAFQCPLLTDFILLPELPPEDKPLTLTGGKLLGPKLQQGVGREP